MTQTKMYESTEGLSPTGKSALRNLILACADTKLLLGFHYGEWTFGTPALEAAIACCSLGQAELGHVRLLHGILNTHFGDDPDNLVESRQPGKFANIAYLDHHLKDWGEFVAANYVVDMALTALLYSMRESSFKPLHMSLEKMIQEEKYHIHHGQGWFRTLAQKSDQTRAKLQNSTDKALADVARWFGPADSEEDAALVDLGIKSHSNAEIFARFLDEVNALAVSLGINLSLRKQNGSWALQKSIDWQGWDAQTRRIRAGGPDEQILYHLRGSKNQVFKLG